MNYHANEPRHPPCPEIYVDIPDDGVSPARVTIATHNGVIIELVATKYTVDARGRPRAWTNGPAPVHREPAGTPAPPPQSRGAQVFLHRGKISTINVDEAGGATA